MPTQTVNNSFLPYKPKQHRARPVLVQHGSYWNFNGQRWPYVGIAGLKELSWSNIGPAFSAAFQLSCITVSEEIQQLTIPKSVHHASKAMADKTCILLSSTHSTPSVCIIYLLKHFLTHLLAMCRRQEMGMVYMGGGLLVDICNACVVEWDFFFFFCIEVCIT